MPDENHRPDLFEIIRATRSMRRLKPDPVPNELIREILEAGICELAPERRREFAVDSPLEGNGFEPLVPLRWDGVCGLPQRLTVNPNSRWIV